MLQLKHKSNKFTANLSFHFHTNNIKLYEEILDNWSSLAPKILN